MLAGLSVSNIAWPGEELPRALRMAADLGLGGVEVAPYNVWGRWDVDEEACRDLRARIEDHGLVCPALQGILFNVPGAALFESDDSRAKMNTHLQRIARIAGALGARACVFGAPRQRDPGTLGAEQAWEVAVNFFRRIGPVFHDHGTALAFEANARVYDCRFVTTTAQAIDLVRDVASPGIRLQIDTGTMFLEAEDPQVIAQAAPLAAHAHVSEPSLQPVGSGEVDHAPLGDALRRSGYSAFLSIEMRAVPDWEAAMRIAVAAVRNNYV